MSDTVFERIRHDIASHDVVLYMKGTAHFPMCGFSAAVVQILSDLQVSFRDINVLEDESLRQGVKRFANWPTIPQLYVKGEFVGGCDGVRELFTTGKLQDILIERGILSG